MRVASKYLKLSQKFLGNIFRKRITWRKQLTKLLKCFYLLVLLAVEAIGDLLFLWKRFSCKKNINPKKILIARIDQFGDVLFSTFLVSLIKQKYPNTKIHYLVHPKTHVLLKKNPNIEQIYFWRDPFLHFIIGRAEGGKKRSFWRITQDNIKTLKLLKKEKYDVIINSRAYPPSWNFFWKLAQPECLVSFDISEQSFLADYRVSYDLYEEEWENHLRLLEPLGIEEENYCFSPQFFNCDYQGLKKKAKLPKDFVVISPVSFDKERLWDRDCWQRVIRFLIGEDFEVVLVGLESQKPYLLEITSLTKSDKVRILTNLSIPELASLIKLSKFVLCIDSFITHLSIALKKQVICLINEEVYYLKGVSKPSWVIDAKSMVPLIPNVIILSTLRTESSLLIDHCKKLIKSERRTNSLL